MELKAVPILESSSLTIIEDEYIPINGSLLNEDFHMLSYN